MGAAKCGDVNIENAGVYKPSQIVLTLQVGTGFCHGFFQCDAPVWLLALLLSEMVAMGAYWIVIPSCHCAFACRAVMYLVCLPQMVVGTVLDEVITWIVDEPVGNYCV